LQLACKPLAVACRALATGSTRLPKPPVKCFATDVTNGEGVEFQVLGPLEARLGDESLPLGGAKQRAVLAMLLLREGEVVPVDRLVDEVWGDDPPASAARGLESYVSRLRQLLNGHGPRLVRRGAGYALELGGAPLDARTFLELQNSASEAAAVGEHERVVELTGAALAVWRGPALADIALASAGRAEAERLEELRLRTYELRFDAELALGRHEQVVGELQALVRQNPYRERFVAQLMVALYRSGRHAEALDEYERTRAALSDDLGLQPSLELRQLSGQIVRQDPQLRRPSTVPPAPSRPPAIRRRTRRLARLVVVGAGVAAAMAFTASGSAPRPPSESATPSEATPVTRVALVLPRAPDAALDDARIRETTNAFRETTSAWGHEAAEIVVGDEIDPTSAEIESAIGRIEAGEFALVLVSGGGVTARALAPTVGRLTGTRFVFIDASLATLSLRGVPNASGMPFADHQTSRLMGYLSGLVSPRGGRPRERADVVSIVASPSTPRVERLVRAFERGARAALPSVTVRVDYAASERDQTTCERLANEQIQAGSDVVFAVAGKCSSAALEVAKLRGVWGIRTNDDGVPDGPHIIATTYKRWETAVKEAITDFELDRLTSGRDRVLGLADDYAVDAWGSNSPEVRAAWSKVVRLCSNIRVHSETGSP
jgi:DNA-binding SARP family transcriptional activator/basic membrane lipoprotein Med (substrate-binding protein (PBP1-ABC) superfamily)